ncbi:MAG: hypothetical protein ACOYOU_15465 [Kiritimatiellia bacterium]
MRVFLLVLLLCMSCSSWGAITDQPTLSGAAVLYDDIQAVCRTLMAAGQNGNIATLSKCYASTTNTEIREAITAANGLFWVLRQKVAEADRYGAHLNKNFPNSKYQSLLEKAANFTTCTNCQNGLSQIPCTACGGTGKCSTCGGRGKISGIVAGDASLGLGNNNLSFGKSGTGLGGGAPARSSVGGGARPLTVTPLGGSDASTQQPCPICSGSSVCKSCKGTKLGKGKCPFCQGLGTLFAPARTSMAYLDVLNQVRSLAFAAGMAERNMVRLDGRWFDAGTAARILRQQKDELADFVRATAEAEQTKDYPTAFQLLDNALARHPDSTYTADVQRVKELLRADADNKNLPEKALRGPGQLEAANNNPCPEIRDSLEAILVACRRGTNVPLLMASQSKANLPQIPEKWKLGEPVLLNRAARVDARIERASRSGFLISELWEFRLVYEDFHWKVWQALEP